MWNSKLFESISKRRSIRNYLDTQIDDNEIHEILQMGLYAPSGKNRQPWRFIIVKNSDVIKKIAKLTVYSRFVRKVPVLVLLFVKKDINYPIEKDMISIGACMENILLAAADKDYGTCAIGELFNCQDNITKYIGVNCKNYLLVCGIAIGKTKSIQCKKEKISLNDFLLSGTIL